MERLASLLATVHGVRFRYFVVRHARALGLMGYMRSLPDGSVAVYAEGETEGLFRLLILLEAGPRYARVERVDISWSQYSGGFDQFQIEFL